jgi:hypothetical protein
MKNTINKEEVTGVLQSSITSVSCMFPSIFTKDDVIRLLNEVQEKIEALPSGEINPAFIQSAGTYGCTIPNVTATNNSSNNGEFVFDIVQQENVETLCKNIIESVEEYITNHDFSNVDVEVEFDHSYYDNEFTVTANFDKSSLGDSICSELRFDTLQKELIDSITSFVEEESEKAALKDSLTSDN